MFKARLSATLFLALAYLAPLADARQAPRSPSSPRGIAVLSSAIARDIKAEEIRTFVKQCRIDRVVIDFAWVTHHWPHTDVKAVSDLVRDLQSEGVVVAAMYRPRALRPRGIKAHLARQEDGTVPRHHNHLCFAHQDSVEWGASWGEKILEACPSLDRILLYNLASLCRCEKCRGGKGRAHAAAFLDACRKKWRKIRQGVRVGHVGVRLEYADRVDFFCPFLSLNRRTASRPVDTSRLVKDMLALRKSAGVKPVMPLVKVCWASSTRNTTEDIVNAIRDTEKAGLGFLLWYYGWIFHPDENRYDAKALVKALGGDWKALEFFFEEAKKKTASKASEPGWIFFPSRESKEGKPARLVLTPAAGKTRTLTVARDVLLIKYLATRAFGKHPQLFVGNKDQNRCLIAFDLLKSLRKKTLKKAELVLDLKLSKRPPTGPFTLAVHAVEGAWDEKTTSWNRHPAYCEEPLLSVKLKPRAAEVQWDVTDIAQKWLSGKIPNHGLLIAMRNIGETVPDLAARLLRTLPWENDPKAALKKAAAEKRLVLTCVRGAHRPADENLAEMLLMAVVFADPMVVSLVKHRFVPLRVAYSPRAYTHSQNLGARDPLAPLGGDCTRIKAPALCVSTPGGKMLASLETIGTFDAELIYGFLQAALARTKKYSLPPAGDADALLEAGALDAAKKAFKKLPAPRKAYGLSRVAALEGDHDLAVRLAHDAAGAASDLAADACVQGGVSLMRKGDFDRATRLLTEAVEKRPPPGRAAEALYYLGCLARVRRDTGAAEDAWKRLQKAFPKSLWALKAAARTKWPDRVGPAETLRSIPDIPPALTSTERAIKPDRTKVLVRRALTYLLDYQAPDGSWPCEEDQYRSSVTALAAKAVDAWSRDVQGALRKRAETAVGQATEWIETWLARSDPKTANHFGGAYALDFLLSRFARQQTPALKKTAQKAVDILLAGQCPNGAWSYSYRFAVTWKGGFGGWPRTDKGRTHSMNTGPALLFLARAKELGFKVDARALKRAVAGLKKMRTDPGVYTYTYPVPISFRKPDQSIARGPVCEQALYRCKAVGKKQLHQTLRTFMKYRDALRIPVKINKSWGNPHAFSSYFYFYAYYHAGLAIQDLGKNTSAPLLLKLREDLLRVPELDSTWVDYHQGGKPYGTAMALLVLRMGK